MNHSQDRAIDQAIKSSTSQQQNAIGIPQKHSISVTELISQAHGVLDQLSNDVSVLTDRLGPVLDFEKVVGEGQRGIEKDVSEPAAIETLSQLVTRLIALSSKVMYVTNRVRV